MCGILGTTVKSYTEVELKSATKTIAHRGPDHLGVYQDNDIYISHLLLAIRGSTEESVQPVWEGNSPWVLAFNGQLYNTKQIISDLAEHPSDVDTVLLYRLIQKFGWDFIEHIHGMFAIALYNKDEQLLRLYRDPGGQKGLYYREDAKGFSFASEIKGLLALPNAEKIIDGYSLNLAQNIGYLPGNRTLVRGVCKLLPSEVVTYDLKKKTCTKNLFDARGLTYYEGLSPEEVMRRTVEEHLQSKKELSINLSGGLDSSLIFHEAVKGGRKVSAFSTRFDIQEGTYNRDSELAAQLARDYGQEFTPIEITKRSYLEHFVSAYATIEEPNFNISLPIYYQTACTEGIHGQGLRVVLSGDGGDELFGGYPHYREMWRLSDLKHTYSSLVMNMYKWFRTGRYIDYNEPAHVFYALRGIRKNWQKGNAAYRDAVAYLHNATFDSMKLYGIKNDDTYRLMVFDRFVWLASENFIRSDKLYMKESMEMRCPLAYQPLRTYMDSHINSSAYIDTVQNKLFLRNLYTGKLPDYITKRADKTGWRAPVEVWYDAAYKDLFLSILKSARNVASEFVDWDRAIQKVEMSDSWPGKTVHLYISIALTIKELGLTD